MVNLELTCSPSIPLSSIVFWAFVNNASGRLSLTERRVHHLCNELVALCPFTFYTARSSPCRPVWTLNPCLIMIGDHRQDGYCVPFASIQFVFFHRFLFWKRLCSHRIPLVVTSSFTTELENRLFGCIKIDMYMSYGGRTLSRIGSRVHQRVKHGYAYAFCRRRTHPSIFCRLTSNAHAECCRTNG